MFNYYLCYWKISNISRAFKNRWSWKLAQKIAAKVDIAPAKPSIWLTRISLLVRFFNIRRKSTYCTQLFNFISVCFAERWILRRRLLPGSAGEHHRVRALHPGDATFGRLFGDGSTVASVGQIHQHGALRLSEHADSRVRRRRTDHVRLHFSFIAVRFFDYRQNFTSKRNFVERTRTVKLLERFSFQ